MRRRWLLSVCLEFLSMATVGAKSAPSGVEPLDLLSGFAGTYTHFVDDELSVTVSYDLQDDTHAPLSYITGMSLTKAQDLFRKAEPDEPVARLTLSASALTKQWVPSGGATVETNNRTVGVNVNHGSRRAQFRFGRSFLDGRFKVGLSPLVTYGALRRRRVDFGNWVPAYRPLLSETGLPSMSLQQRSLVWDWAQGMPSRSRLQGLGVSLRLHTGGHGWFSATLFDGSDRSRLWSMRADMPLVKPSNACFSVERAWQVGTADKMRY